MARKFFVLPRPSFLFALTLVLGLGGGVVFDRRVLTAFVPSGSIPPNAVSEFRLMAEAWNTVQRFFVGRSALQPRLLAYGAIAGMVEALGDTGHTTFLPPEMVRQMRQLAKGEFTGIGAEVQMKNGQVVVVAPIDGSPAQQASLRPGDVILKVDGKEIAKLTLDEVVARISGRKGTPVTLTLLSPQSGRTREVTVVRDAIMIPSVTWQRLPGTTVGHLRIARFHEGLTAQLKKALREIEAEKLSGVILDLRSNPGGLLEEAIGTASQFLKSGTVLLQRNAQGQIVPVPVQTGATFDLPIVVLINSGTASAAEIVAGALQDGRRAVLIGEKTFGAGTVLHEFRLSDGSALLLAVEEWLTPSGQAIWHKGIAPNIAVPLSREVALLLPPEERNLSPADLRASRDEQLLQGLEILTRQASSPTP